jgi:hypothetical protein
MIDIASQLNAIHPGAPAPGDPGCSAHGVGLLAAGAFVTDPTTASRLVPHPVCPPR